jgi:hypothetical protein
MKRALNNLLEINEKQTKSIESGIYSMAYFMKQGVNISCIACYDYTQYCNLAKSGDKLSPLIFIQL